MTSEELRLIAERYGVMSRQYYEALGAFLEATRDVTSSDA